MGTTEKAILKRNKRLEEFFKSKNYDVKILGSKDKPAVIYKDKILSCYVKNFDLIFNDRPFGGEVLFTVKLTEIPDTRYDAQIAQWLDVYHHRPIYKLQLTCDDLFYSGLKNNEPAFTKNSPVVFFNRDKAIKVQRELFENYNIDTQIY